MDENKSWNIQGCKNWSGPPPTLKTAPVVCWDHDPHSSLKRKKKGRKKKKEKKQNIYKYLVCMSPLKNVQFPSSPGRRVSVLWRWSFSRGQAVGLRQWCRPFRLEETKTTILPFNVVPVDLWPWGSIPSPSLPHLPPVYVQKDIYIFIDIWIWSHNMSACPLGEHSRLDTWPHPRTSSSDGGEKKKILHLLWIPHFKAVSLFPTS